MCVIVDTCCIHKVFNTKAQDHFRFAPLFAWIESKHGRLIYGGTKYTKELRCMSQFLRIFQDYERQGKLIRLNDAAVDAFALKAKAKVKSKVFNDEHLVGIVSVSRCRVICTDDKAAIPFLTRRDLYEIVPMKPPKIYSKNSHAHLCSGKSIVSVCRS